MEANKEASTISGCSIRELRNVQAVKVYKVVSGEAPSVKAYSRWQLAASVEQQSLSEQPQQLNDWKALYTQFLADHTLGTVPYRWERGAKQAWLVEATFVTPLHILVVDGPVFYESKVSGIEKAALIKRRLAAEHDLDIEEPLMEALGGKGMAAMVRETASEWELILPHGLLEGLKLEERVVAGFQKHARMPITSKWCIGGGGSSWQPWLEGETDMSMIPDLSTDFLG